MNRKQLQAVSPVSSVNSNPGRSIFTCSNCLEQYVCGDGIPAPKVAGFSLTNQMTNGSSQISVLEAIAAIFNINLEAGVAISLLENLEVCLQCGSHLADMYKYYQEFLQLSAKDSGIYELIRLSLRAETKLTEEQVQNIAEKSYQSQTAISSPIQQNGGDYIKPDIGPFASTNPNARISKRLSMKRTLREVDCDVEDEDTNYAKIQKLFSGRGRARSMYTNVINKEPNLLYAFAAGQAPAVKKADSKLPFACPSPGCGRAFGFRHSLGNHVKIHLPKNKKSPGRPKVVTQHIAIKKEPVAQERRVFSCPEPGCGKVFTFKQSLNRHSKKHEVKEVIKTKPAVKEVIKTKPTVNEVTKHTVNEVIKTKPTINEVIKTKPTINEEIKTIGSSKNAKKARKPFSTFEKSVLPKLLVATTGKQPSKLNGHTSKAKPTPSKNPHNCDFCTASFQSVYLLNQHLLRHRFEASDGPFACNQCGQVYRTKADLRKHKIVSHKVQEVSKFVKCCPLCKKDYLRPQMLVSHLVVKHKLSRDRALKKVGLPVPKAGTSTELKVKKFAKTKFSTPESAKLSK